MNIQFGRGKTEYGTGVQIDLTGEEVAMAIYTYLMAHNVIIDGAATIRVNGEMIKDGDMYIDPSGRVIADGIGWSGRGYKE
jgi:hypothetical protein